MDDAALEANAAALSLLALAQQGATGTVSFAGRSLRLAEGDFTSVGSSEDDEPLWDFIRRSERLNRTQLDALLEQSQASPPAPGDKQGEIEDAEARFRQALQSWEGAEQHRVGPLVRAFYLERLVRCLRVEGATPSALRAPAQEDTTPLADAPRFKTLPLLLDALARVALEQDASTIGAELRARLQWLPGPFASDARHWAALGDVTEESTLAAILAKRPASVPAIAALIHAGLARLMSPPKAALAIATRKETLPPPAPRLTALPEDDVEPLCAATLAEYPRLQLAPGLAEVSAAPFVAVRPQPLQPRDPELIDPLRALELEIEELEHATGNEMALAARWEAAADLWEHRLDCPTEATRALREAAAAYPFSPRILQRTAMACASTGHHSLAAEYATAAVAVAGDEQEQRAAELLAAKLQLRKFDCGAALEHLQRAAALGAESAVEAELLERIAVLSLTHYGPGQRSADAFARAASALSSHPGRACALWAVAHDIAPDSRHNALSFAASLAAAGYPQAGAGVVMDFTTRLPQREDRVAILIESATRAELAGLGLLALQALLDAFALNPELPVTHGPLAEHLNLDTLDAAEQVAVSQDLANHCAPQKRAHYLLQAGAAACRCPGEAELGRLLLQMAMAEGASHADVVAIMSDVPNAPPTPLPSLVAAMRKRAEESEDENEQSQLYRRLAGLEHASGNPRGTISAALRCLTLSPRDTVAAARMLRAAALLGDRTILSEALHYSARATEDERRRALHLCSLAGLLERAGDVDEALICAESALRDDRYAAAASRIALRHHDKLPAARAHALLGRALRAFPDLPPLLAQRARAAQAAGDLAAAHDALARWTVASPFDPVPRRLRLEYNLASPDQPPLLLGAAALIEVMQNHGDLVLITNACSRAAEQGDLSGAARLLLQLVQHTGNVDPLLAERALQFARLAADAQLVSSALEHLAHCQEGKERRRTLQLLAEQHRRRGDGVAELRTRLRILGESGYDMESVDRLSDLFAAAGDGKRLGAVTTLALQSVRTPPERRTLWLRMACARSELSGDYAGMLRHIGSLLTEQSRDPLTVRDAVGIALHLSPSVAVGVRGVFELTQRLPPLTGSMIALGLVKTAQEVLNDTEMALELCASAAVRFPLCGDLLLLLESLALGEQAVPTAIATYDALIASAAGRQGRRALHYRAGRFLERVNEDRDALDRYLKALSLAPAPGTILVSIERVAEQLKEYTALREAYCLIARHTPDKATHERFASWAYALSRKYEPDIAVAIAAEFKVMPPGGDALRPTASFEGPPPKMPDPTSLRPAAWERMPQKPGHTQPGLSSGGPKLSEPALRAAAADGNLESQAALAQFLKQKGSVEEAHSLFAQVVRADPARTDALRALRATASALSADAVRHVCEQWLSLFDATVVSPAPLPFHPEYWTSDELDHLLSGDLPMEVKRVLTLLWQCARSVPDLLAPLERYGVGARDLAMAHNSPRITRATSNISAQLQLPRVPIYFRPQGEAITVAAVQPCAALVPKTLEAAGDLDAQIAYALVQATPANAVILAPDPAIVGHLIGGLLAAFGPPGAVAAASLHDKVMAAALWNAVPTREQDFVRRTVDTYLLMFQPEAMRQRAELAALRAALLVGGDPRSPLRLLRERTKFPGDGDFIRACAEGPMLTELVRTSLSESYLAAVGRAL